MSGPMPKNANERARRNKDVIEQRLVPLHRAGQPPLPEGVEWHPQTVEWWETWGRSPLAADFTADDWSYLLDTALMHSEFWTKRRFELAGEVRLRVAAFGMTPADRARLRIVFADAEAKDGERAARGAAGSAAGSSKWAGLKVVGDR